MKIKHKQGCKSHCTKTKGIEEKRSKLLQRPLVVLKTLIIHFPPNTLQEARRHHLPYNGTLSATNSPPTSKQINNHLSITQDNPKRLKKAFHKVQASSIRVLDSILQITVSSWKYISRVQT